MDSLDVLDELTAEQAGQLLLAMRDYNEGKQVQLSGLLKAVFIPFKNQFDRDFEKYQAIVLRNRENGAKGGKPKQTQENPVGILGTQTNPDKPDNDSDSKNDNGNESDSKSNTDLQPQPIPAPPLPKPETVEQRKQKFAQKLEPWKETYTREMLNDFYLYWTEKGEQDRKMRFEKEKVFEVERRLQYWKKIQDQKQNRFQQVQTPPKIRIVDGKFK